MLVLLNGEHVVVEWVDHEFTEEPVYVYNFEVEDFHTCFVGASGILVHNGSINGVKVCETSSTSSDTQNTDNASRTYNPSKKHELGHGWGSENPIPDIKTGQKLLDTAYSSSANKQLYNLYDGKLIKFQPDTVTGWHAYAVTNTAKEVPNDVLKAMLSDGLISKSEYKKYIKNK